MHFTESSQQSDCCQAHLASSRATVNLTCALLYDLLGMAKNVFGVEGRPHGNRS